MKTRFIFLFLLILSSISSFSQNSFKGSTSSVNSEEEKSLSKFLNSYTLLTLDTKNLNDFVKKNKNKADINLSLSSNVNWNLTLHENELRAGLSKAIVFGKEGKEEVIDNTECNTYAGYLNDDVSQYVRLYISEDEVKGIIVDKNKGTFVIEPLSKFSKSSKDNRLVVYNLSDSKLQNEFCGVKDESVSEALKGARTSIISPVPTACRILEVTTEGDGEYFIAHGSNANNSFNDMLATMNVVEGVYNTTFNTRIVIVNQFLWQNPATDPYTSFQVLGNGVIDQYKSYYNSNRSGQLRDAGIFFTGKQLIDQSVGQLNGAVPADGIGAICRDLSNSYAFASDHPFMFYTLTHEIGHLFNATHPSPGGTDCIPNRSVMCSGANVANVFFANASINQVNSHLAGGENCLRSFSSIGMTGPTSLCVSSSGAYEALGGIQFQNNNWVWTSSSNISLSSTTGKIITATGLWNGNGWVQATQTQGCEIAYRYNIAVGAPVISFTVNGQPFQNGSICRNSNAYIDVVNHTTNNSYSWSLNAGSTGSLSGSGPFATFSNSNIACSGISVQVTNSCGTSSTGLTICTVNCARSEFTAYPNPAKDYVYIEFDHTETLDALPETIKLYSESSANPVKSVNISNLFEKKGFKDGNKVEINVKDLPRGTYFLHVQSKNNSDKTEKIRILLE